MGKLTRLLTIVVAAWFSLSIFTPEAPLRAAQQQPAQGGDEIPCHPSGPPPGTVEIGPTSTVSLNPPVIEVADDRVVSEPIDLTSEFPLLMGGTDSGLATPRCTTSFDLEQPIPSGTPPNGPNLTLPQVSLPLPPTAFLPPITFVPPPDCLRNPRAPAPCGPPLDCRLPFCGRDIIFVHGMIDESLIDMVRALHHGGPNDVLARWATSPSAFLSQNGYFRTGADANWRPFILNKLGPAYRNAGFPYGPRFLVAAWPTTQRMEYGVHAVLFQIAEAMRSGRNVRTLSFATSQTNIVSASLTGPGFCGRGCIIVSGSTGGPLSIAAMNIAANASRPWTSSSLRILPSFIKGHVAFHPALGGSEVAWHALAIANSFSGGCGVVPDLLSVLDGRSWPPGLITSCAAAQHLNHSVLLDLMPPVMNTMWRPYMTATPSSITYAVPTLVVAGAHPTEHSAIHWRAPALPGYDDGVLSVDSQMGRAWTPATSPRSLQLNSWGLLGARYYDRGSPAARAVAFFLDQNHELVRRPLAHAAAPNPYLTPNGMVLRDVVLNEVPAASSGLPNVFSFLQSTASHLFRRRVGDSSHPDSQPNDTNDGCAPGSYSYQPTGIYFGPQANVSEESRAVFDASVYTTRGRNHFQIVEAATGAIPHLSPSLAGAIEGEEKGRLLRLRFKLPLLPVFELKFWVWKRQYIRMRGWQCRDEIDYAFDFAFRR